MMRYLFAAILFGQMLLAGMGELTLFIFRDGMPQSGATVLIDDNLTHTTDADGAIYVRLEEGAHRAVINAYEGERLIAHAKQPFAIAAGQNTELIVALTATGEVARIEAETPAGAVDANVSQVVEANLTSGILAGVLVNMEDQKPIEKAKVFVKGSSMTAISDANGSFTLELTEGNHTLSIIHDKFSAQTLTVTIVGDTRTEKSIELSPAGLEMEEFVVLVPHVEGTIAADLSEQKNSDSMGNVLGSAQFSKTGDSSAAAALKRVSGITIVGGKYVFIRGLGDRYSTILLNDMYIPSPEPTKRVVPLDIFPTSVISSIKIQKSYASDIPGSFGGGAVLIRSKNLSDEGFKLNAGVSLSFESDIGSTIITNPDNKIGIPQSVIDASANFKEIAFNTAMTKTMADYRQYNTQNAMLLPGYKFSAGVGDSYTLANGWKLGYLGSFFYGTTPSSDTVAFNKYVYSDGVGELLEATSTREVYEVAQKYGGLVSIGLDVGDMLKLKYSMLWIEEEKESTTTGKTDNSGTTVDYDYTYLEYIRQTIFMNQLNMEYELGTAQNVDGVWDNLIIEAAAEYGMALRKEPGTIEYARNYLSGQTYLDQKTWYLYSDLIDNVFNYRADFKLPYLFNDVENYTQAGLFIYNKSRTADNRRFKMEHFLGDQTDSSAIDTLFSSANASSSDIAFSTNFREDDAYSATENQLAFYLKQFLSVTPAFDVIAGVRQESSTQQLIDTATKKPYTPLESSNLLPAVALTYRLGDAVQLRGGYSVTLSRPDFREFSPNRFKDPITGNIIFGNPDLKSTAITNYDAKVEWFLSAEESIALSLFAKEFENPIETINVLDIQSGSSTQLVSFRNAISASSYGLEFDLRKRFGFLGDWMENMVFGTNYSYIYSQVKLNYVANDEFLSNLTSTERPMQGQSPYVVNMQFGYDAVDGGSSLLLLYNEIGKRIYALGTYGNADEYEQPFRKLDIAGSTKVSLLGLEDLTLKAKASNLLDSEVVITKGENIARTYKPGQSYSLSLSGSF
ncbi:MAG: hypothetical protein KU37_04170 [Sulfuricurvum sp. PC08-66]|nr:MAG: hypothetical protein KU37_04170 [Sulfuricurvum sp. PC08-66]